MKGVRPFVLTSKLDHGPRSNTKETISISKSIYKILDKAFVLKGNFLML